jgi:hypothetical protein
LAALAHAADTPAKWARLVQQQTAILGPEAVAPFADFSTRQSVINKALSVKELITLKRQEEASADTSTLKNLRAAGIDPKSPEGRAAILKQGQTSVTVNNNAPLTKANQTKVQDRVIKDTEILASLDNVSRDFKPEFQKLGTRFDNLVTSIKSKAGLKVSPEDRKQLQQFSRFKSRSINIINQRLNDLSGAAVSPQEATRIKKGLPDPGEGLFDGDDPISFKSKMDTAMLDFRRAIARRNWVLRQGTADKPWEAFGLREMDSIMSKREVEIRQQVTTENPNMQPDLVDAQIATILSQEFGIQFGDQ